MTFNKEELESASHAARKMTELGADMGSLRHEFDSGFGDASLGETEAPRSSRLQDPEQQDSGLGLGREQEDSDGEPDRDLATHRPAEVAAMAAETRAPPRPVAMAPKAASRPAEKRSPRRPKKTINPGRSSSLQYVSASQPSSAASTPVSGHTISRLPHDTYRGPRSLPSQAEEEVQRMYLEKQWRLIQLQQQLSYLLPNRDGDT